MLADPNKYLIYMRESPDIVVGMLVLVIGPFENAHDEENYGKQLWTKALVVQAHSNKAFSTWVELHFPHSAGAARWWRKSWLLPC